MKISTKEIYISYLAILVVSSLIFYFVAGQDIDMSTFRSFIPSIFLTGFIVILFSFFFVYDDNIDPTEKEKLAYHIAFIVSFLLIPVSYFIAAKN